MSRKSVSVLLFLCFAVLFYFVTPCFSSEKTEEPSPKNLFKNLTSSKAEERSFAKSYIRTRKPVALIPLLQKGILQEGGEGRKIYYDTLKIYPLESNMDVWLEILDKTGSYPFKIEVMEYISSKGRIRSIVLPIAAQLKNPFEEVRNAAAKILARIGDDRVYPVVLSMMRDASSSAVRAVAVDVTDNYLYDDRLKDELVSMLNDSDGIVKAYAIKAVKHHGIDSATPAIRRIAESYGDSISKYAALRYLAETSPGLAIGVCAGTVNDRDRVVRLASANIMRRELSPSSAYPVCSRLKTESDESVKDVLMDFLIYSRHIPDTEGVRRILRSDTEKLLRVKAAYVLGLTKGDTSVNALAASLTDKEPEVRAEACSSLGSFQNNTAATNALIRMTKASEPRYVRSAALFAIIKSKTREATVSLFDLFAAEKDVIFRNDLYHAVRGLIVQYH